MEILVKGKYCVTTFYHCQRFGHTALRCDAKIEVTYFVLNLFVIKILGTVSNEKKSIYCTRNIKSDVDHTANGTRCFKVMEGELDKIRTTKKWKFNSTDENFKG